MTDNVFIGSAAGSLGGMMLGTYDVYKSQSKYGFSEKAFLGGTGDVIMGGVFGAGAGALFMIFYPLPQIAIGLSAVASLCAKLKQIFNS